MLSDYSLLFVQGFMEYSYLFYGYYNNTVVADTNFSYNIPLAYLLTAAFYFAFCLICIIARYVSEQTQYCLILLTKISGPVCMHVYMSSHLSKRFRLIVKIRRMRNDI